MISPGMKNSLCLILCIFCGLSLFAQPPQLIRKTKTVMKAATRYMMDSISLNGGFVWYYLPDKSRRWGEMEAYPSMIWVQDGGTVSVGNVLLDAYAATNDEDYYHWARQSALTLIGGQSPNGGWNYMFDLNGKASLKNWYATIGKNGWRLEEFQHYYGNDTFDDDVTSGAARFLLRLYLLKKDSGIKAALDKAIHFICISQYPNGGWPQRFPLRYDFSKNGKPDYTSFHTFNDDVIWENISFLIQCRDALGDTSLNARIRKGMDFYLLSQKPSGAWGQQYDSNLHVAGARSYEPAAYLPRTTFHNALLLLRFYRITGNEKYLQAVPNAIQWLENTRLKGNSHGRFTHPLFIDTLTQQPLYVHRKGSNVVHGNYYTDSSDQRLLAHMSGKSSLPLETLKAAFQQASHPTRERNISGDDIRSILSSIDSKSRWLDQHVMISHPYIGDGVEAAPTEQYASTFVGDDTDTSPFRDTTDQQYISTPLYVRNMQSLIGFLQQYKPKRIVWTPRQLLRSKPLTLGRPILKGFGPGRSIEFNGLEDGLILPAIPFQNWPATIIELTFRPDRDGSKEPRILHAEDEDGNRVTLEARLTKDGHWYPDVFLKNGITGERQTLMDSSRRYRTNAWYKIALSWDGTNMQCFVNGQQTGEGRISMYPFASGNIALGMRLNRVNPFKGAIRRIRFYPYDRYPKNRS